MGELDPAIEAALKIIAKEWGDEAIVRGNTMRTDIDAIPTGAMTLDLAIGCGGIPRGRFTEVYGTPSAGKTSLGLSAMANAQRMGLAVAYIDMENALDPAWVATMGVDLSNVLIAQPSCAEEALGIAKHLIHTGKLGFIVLDSVASLVPKAELDADLAKDDRIASRALLLQKFLSRNVAMVHQSNTAFLLINQIRANPSPYGASEVQPGGNALKFYCSLRIDLRAPTSDKITKDGEVIGTRITAKLVKNKIGAPYQVVGYDFMYGHGIDKEGSLIDAATSVGIIIKKGGWFATPDGVSLGQGRENLKEKLREDEALRTEIESATVALMKVATGGE